MHADHHALFLHHGHDEGVYDKSDGLSRFDAAVLLGHDADVHDDGDGAHDDDARNDDDDGHGALLDADDDVYVASEQWGESHENDA